MLVEDYLWAVVSLPPGVFQPYSGVKTSILLMDKNKAKQDDSVLFVKVDNDGTNLGAKRSSIEGSDLPTALSDLRAFHNNRAIYSNISSVVNRRSILAEKDSNLTISRYVEMQDIQSDYASVSLGNYITESKDKTKKQVIDVWSVSNRMGFVGSKEYFEKDVPSTNISNYKMIMPNYFAYNPSRINVGSIAFNDSEQVGCVSPMYVVFSVTDTTLNDNYLLHLLKSKEFNDYVNSKAQGGVRQQLRFSSLCDFQIPLPPLPVQEEIVAEIEGYQKIIDGARQVVENYKPTIKIDPDWEMIELGELATVTSSKRIFQNEYVSSGIPFYRTKEIVELSQNNPISLELYIAKEKYDSIKDKFDVPKQGDILVSAVGTIGISWIVSDNRKFYFKDGNLLWVKNIKDILPQFLKLVFDSIFSTRLNEFIIGAAYKALTIVKLKQIKIPLPDREIQNHIIAQIEAEQEIVNSNKKLIEMYEQKIKDKIAEVWGE